MSLTHRLRDELCGAGSGGRTHRLAETSALLRFGGALTLRERTPGWVLDTSVPSVLRHARTAIAELFDVRATVEAHEPGGLATRRRYRLRVDSAMALTALGLLDGEGHPAQACPPRLVASRPARVAYVRGTLMAAGVLSGPGRAPHLEVRAPSAPAAAELAELLAALEVEGARAGPHGEGWRVVCKSGEGIASTLALTGAHGTYLAFDEGRLRRQLRGEVTRAANADRANLGRAVSASARQVRAIEALLGADGAWDRLPADLQETALARVANPQASLTELARLLGAPRATVHRRLQRLEHEQTGEGEAPPVVG